MKQFIALLVFYSSVTHSQNIDYNTKKGFIANGYDVVAYFNNEAKTGNKLFATEFNGVRLKFSSKENLDLFNKNLEKYMPQYGGYCAYAVALKNSKISINPETFTIEDGKLYLFYNAWGTNTLELWQKEKPTLLKQKGNKNWEQLKLKK